MTNKITIKNNVKIIDDNYVVKKKTNDIEQVYNYLYSRAFNYFPEIVNIDKDKIYYRYIKDINEPLEQKITDLMNTISLLHNKTTFYKEIDLDNYKATYEDLNDKIIDIYNYYNELMENIESNIYMSPSNYLIARNISIIYNALNYSKESLETWYKLIENKRKVRVVTIHNNLSLDHYIKDDKPYLISWDKAKIDMPIYDIINLYKKHYLDFDFTEALRLYFSKYPFTEEEMTLFLTIISIPNKISLKDSEYKTVLSIRRQLDYIYKTSELVKEYSIKQKTNE